MKKILIFTKFITIYLFLSSLALSSTNDFFKEGKILFDEKFQIELCNNADNFINTFMSNTGTASQKFTSILRTLD